MISYQEKLIKSIPNLITFLNLILGFSSIKLTFEGNYKLAVSFIIISMFLDFLDGKAARKLNAESSLGKELDSLSDIVSFGVAPSILIWIIFPFQPNLLGISLMIFLICGAYRLARFNLKSSSKHPSGYFSGFPITAAGVLLALMSLYNEILPSYFLFALIILLSVSMVTNIPFYSLKKIARFNTLLVVFLLMVFIFSLFLPSILTIILTAYYLSGLALLLNMLVYKRVQKDPKEWYPQ